MIFCYSNSSKLNGGESNVNRFFFAVQITTVIFFFSMRLCHVFSKLLIHLFFFTEHLINLVLAEQSFKIYPILFVFHIVSFLQPQFFKFLNKPFRTMALESKQYCSFLLSFHNCNFRHCVESLNKSFPDSFSTQLSLKVNFYL